MSGPFCGRCGGSRWRHRRWVRWTAEALFVVRAVNAVKTDRCGRTTVAWWR